MGLKSLLWYGDQGGKGCESHFLFYCLLSLFEAFSKYTDDERVMINDQDMLYFGVKELCDSTRWNQQFSLIRTEETLDWALPKANR